MALAERKYVLTGVNCRTWPIPMPRDVEIEDIRQELLPRNIRFAWLDILCLRQGMGEDQLPPNLTPDHPQQPRENCCRVRSGSPMCHSLGQYTGLQWGPGRQTQQYWCTSMEWAGRLLQGCAFGGMIGTGCGVRGLYKKPLISTILCLQVVSSTGSIRSWCRGRPGYSGVEPSCIRSGPGCRELTFLEPGLPGFYGPMLEVHWETQCACRRSLCGAAIETFSLSLGAALVP
ncbi:hypothetical protein EV426DRAFT_571779 [Tirmania nivea]|nr:hypothetical protein EV426DRAFT_571779 [Tirmania nivea]